MSGPMAAGFGLEAAVLTSAESLAQGAAEIAAGLEEASRQAEETRARRRQERRQMRAARQAGVDKNQRAIAEKTARLQRLHDAWHRLGKTDAGIRLPAAPDAADTTACADYLATLDKHIAKLDALLRQSAASMPASARADLEILMAEAISVEAQLMAYLAQARLAGASTDIVAERQALVAHVLERLQLDEAAGLPESLDQLARAVIQAPTPQRAEALATELRLQVQQHNDERVRAAEQTRLREAAVIVLEHSLKDLGYTVEDIEETLFVEGGVAHFQRPGWGDYFVRLRIDPKRSTMNFNVVRAGTAGEDRKQEDMLAEERWCSEFPKIFETLKARGIPITVTRLLQAGEAPVQVVDAASLPRSAAEDHRPVTLKARSVE